MLIITIGCLKLTLLCFFVGLMLTTKRMQKYVQNATIIVSFEIGGNQHVTIPTYYTMIIFFNQQWQNTAVPRDHRDA